MRILLWALGTFLVWHLIGAVVLTCIDRDERLKEWADHAPYGLDMFIPAAWPIILWFWRERKHSA